MKIDPAEIRTHSRPPAEPVAIGHIAVERGEEEVEAGADLSRLAAAVAKRGGVTELVEDARHEHDRQHAEQCPGRIERGADAVGRAVPEVQPPVGDRQDDQDGHEDGRREEYLQSGGDGVDRAPPEEPEAQVHRQGRGRIRGAGRAHGRHEATIGGGVRRSCRTSAAVTTHTVASVTLAAISSSVRSPLACSAIR